MKLFARLLTDDFPGTLAFWRDGVQLAVKFGDEGIGYALLDVGNEQAGIELFARQAFSAALGQALPLAGQSAVIVLSVDDVDATYARLLEHGARAVAEPKDRPEWMARTAHVADPDGHLLEIYSALAPASAPQE
jgi:catechol 2,3-dioxygenase-like lactoylglutathione lyase family enzyme